MEPENPVPSIEDDVVVPNHRASGGTDTKPERPGIFGNRNRTKVAAKTPRVPKDDPPIIPGQFVEGMTQVYGMLGAVFMPFKPPLGIAFVENAESCAQAWDKAAQQVPAIRRMLAGGGNAAVIAALIAVHFPILQAGLVGTEMGARLNPAEAMEQYLRDQTEATPE